MMSGHFLPGAPCTGSTCPVTQLAALIEPGVTAPKLVTLQHALLPIWLLSMLLLLLLLLLSSTACWCWLTAAVRPPLLLLLLVAVTLCM
jgi:hypothetical protein